jgi:hypothetical protein
MPDTGEAMKHIHAAIAKAMSMQIDKLIVEGDKSTSSTLRESYAIRADYFNRVRKDIVLQESTLNKQLLDSIHESMRKRSFDEMLKRTILDTCEQYGAHAEILEKLSIALDTEQGKDAARSLTLQDCTNVDLLIQKFLTIYKDESE